MGMVILSEIEFTKVIKKSDQRKCYHDKSLALQSVKTAWQIKT